MAMKHFNGAYLGRMYRKKGSLLDLDSGLYNI